MGRIEVLAHRKIKLLVLRCCRAGARPGHHRRLDHAGQGERHSWPSMSAGLRPVLILCCNQLPPSMAFKRVATCAASLQQPDSRGSHTGRAALQVLTDAASGGPGYEAVFSGHEAPHMEPP